MRVGYLFLSLNLFDFYSAEGASGVDVNSKGVAGGFYRSFVRNAAESGIGRDYYVNILRNQDFYSAEGSVGVNGAVAVYYGV